MFQKHPGWDDWVNALKGMTLSHEAQGYGWRALSLAGAAAEVRETKKWPCPTSDQGVRDRYHNPARRTLGREDAERAWAEGGAMALDQVIEYARSR